MNLDKFKNKIKLLTPKNDLLVNEGYSFTSIDEIKNEFDLKGKTIFSKKEGLFLNFVLHNETNSFRVNNLFFSKMDKEIIEGHIVFGSIEGGYISYNIEEKNFYASYSDDIMGSMLLICENEEQFFEILLIVAEYSSKAYEGLIIDEDEELLNEYIKKCENIFLNGNYEYLFI